MIWSPALPLFCIDWRSTLNQLTVRLSCVCFFFWRTGRLRRIAALVIPWLHNFCLVILLVFFCVRGGGWVSYVSWCWACPTVNPIRIGHRDDISFPKQKALYCRWMFLNLIHDITPMMRSLDVCFIRWVGKGFVQWTFFHRRLLSAL